MSICENCKYFFCDKSVGDYECENRDLPEDIADLFSDDKVTSYPYFKEGSYSFIPPCIEGLYEG